MQYLTYSDFTRNYFQRQERYDCDKLSRGIIKMFLITIGVPESDITLTEGNNCSDINFKRGDYMFLSEIKERYGYNSNVFNDHIVEKIKVQALVNKKKNYEKCKLSLFSLYNDGVIKITEDIEQNVLGIRKVLAPKTTMLDDNTMIEKEFVSIKPEKQVYFVIAYDSTINQYKPVFSNEPIDINKLNIVSDGPSFVESVQLL